MPELINHTLLLQKYQLPSGMLRQSKGFERD